MRVRVRQRRDVLVRFVRTETWPAPDVLGPEERATLARLRSTEARRDYRAAHVLARTMLAELADCDPARLRFRTSPRGRPEVIAPRGAPRLRFSLSHADGIALCAVAEGWDVGADVESLRNVGPDPLGVAETVCSARERDALRRVPASARAAHVLVMWTRKEAMAKATGLGLALGGGTRPPAVATVSSVCLTPHHLAAVAVLGASPRHVALRIEETR